MKERIKKILLDKRLFFFVIFLYFQFHIRVPKLYLESGILYSLIKKDGFLSHFLSRGLAGNSRRVELPHY